MNQLSNLSDDPKSTSGDDLADIERATPSGRRYTERRWTLGSSAGLVEGAKQESAIVSLAWVVLPLVGALIVGIIFLR
jgi:hypothetical protein